MVNDSVILKIILKMCIFSFISMIILCISVHFYVLISALDTTLLYFYALNAVHTSIITKLVCFSGLYSEDSSSLFIHFPVSLLGWFE